MPSSRTALLLVAVAVGRATYISQAAEKDTSVNWENDTLVKNLRQKIMRGARGAAQLGRELKLHNQLGVTRGQMAGARES